MVRGRPRAPGARARHRGLGGGREPGADTLVLGPTAALPAGLALLDSPDVDSVREEDRALARQLLAAADAWLFVTTARSSLLAPQLLEIDHHFELQPLDEGRVRLMHGERFRGVLAPLGGRALPQARDSFEAMNQAMKLRAERQPGG